MAKTEHVDPICRSLDELPYPFDKYPDHYSQWEDCVEEYRKLMLQVERLGNMLNAEHQGVSMDT